MVEAGGAVPFPPPLDAHSKEAIDWFDENVTVFAKDFGLMEGFLKETGLSGEARSAFIRKLDAIYGHSVKMAGERAKEKADAGNQD